MRFINTSLDTLEDQLMIWKARVENFRVDNEMFDEDEQSQMYLKCGKDQIDIDFQDVKITVADLLQNYIKIQKQLHDFVPINMGIEDPTLGIRISEYNKLQLERDNNLKTTTENNPLIQAYDASLEKIRRDMSEALIMLRTDMQFPGTNCCNKKNR